MRSWRSLIDPGGRLSSSLARLCTKLSHLGGRLRHHLTDSIGQVVADTVQETLQGLWGNPSPQRADRSFDSYRSRDPSYHQGHSSWHERSYGSWEDQEDDYYRTEHRDWQEEETQPPEESRPRTGRLSMAVACGLQAASGWLKQISGCWRWTGAGVIGTLVAGLVFVAGPVAAAGVSLIGAAGSLSALSELSRTNSSPPQYRTW